MQTVRRQAFAAFTLTVYGSMFVADLDALAERLDRQKGESGASRGHVRDIDDLANERPEVSRVADLP